MGFGLSGFATAHRRAQLAAASGLAAAVAALSGCAAPAQPSPPLRQAAVLSSDVFAYDNLDFRTNREPIFTPNGECGGLPEQLLNKLGFQFSQYEKPAQSGSGSSSVQGCQLPMGASPTTFTVSAATAPFRDYWTTRVSAHDAPGSTYSGLLAAKRVIMSERYYAVDYLAGTLATSASSYSAATCSTAVDTGSPYPLVISYNLASSGAPVASAATVFSQECPKTHELAEKLLAALDKDGGSRVG